MAYIYKCLYNKSISDNFSKQNHEGHVTSSKQTKPGQTSHTHTLVCFYLVVAKHLFWCITTTFDGVVYVHTQ